MTATHNLYRAITEYDKVPAGKRARWKNDHPALAEAIAAARHEGWI